MCTYNAENFIKKTIDNLIEQKYDNYEILIFDDQSSDNTLDILKEYENKYQNIVIFNDKKRGPYEGLNYLIKKAKGDYVAVQDHDDLWFENKLEKQVIFLERNKQYIGCGASVYYYFQSDNKFYPKINEGVKKKVTHTTLMFRNKLGITYNASKTLADEHFMSVILKGDLYQLREPLTIRRIWSNGMNLSEKRFKLNMKTINELKELHIKPLYMIDLLSRRFRPWWLNKILRKRHKSLSFDKFKNNQVTIYIEINRFIPLL